MDFSTTTCHFCDSSNLISETNLGQVEVWCNDCSRYVEQLPKPTITYLDRKVTIDRALLDGCVIGWERLFLRTIREIQYLSPKQKQKFSQICQKHGLEVEA